MPWCTLSELNTLDVICASVRLCGHYVLNCSVGTEGEEGGRVMENCIPFTALLRFSAPCVQRGERINREMKMASCHSVFSYIYCCTKVACGQAGLPVMVQHACIITE